MKQDYSAHYYEAGYQQGKAVRSAMKFLCFLAGSAFGAVALFVLLCFLESSRK